MNGKNGHWALKYQVAVQKRQHAGIKSTIICPFFIEGAAGIFFGFMGSAQVHKVTAKIPVGDDVCLHTVETAPVYCKGAKGVEVDIGFGKGFFEVKTAFGFSGDRCYGMQGVYNAKHVGVRRAHFKGAASSHKVADCGAAIVAFVGAILAIDIGYELLYRDVEPAAAHGGVFVHAAARGRGVIGNHENELFRYTACKAALHEGHNIGVVEQAIEIGEDAVEIIYYRIRLA
jgi:hypothetical protein